MTMVIIKAIKPIKVPNAKAIVVATNLPTKVFIIGSP
jgi:ribosomal protein L30E